jgi:hypothetical protein
LAGKFYKRDENFVGLLEEPWPSFKWIDYYKFLLMMMTLSDMIGRDEMRD